MEPDAIRVRVSRPSNLISAKVGAENTVKVVSSVSSDNLITSLNQLEGINLSNLKDGDILVYDSILQVWKNEEELDGGEY